ncbi:ABC transporter ATP-binding protein [Methanocalculus chunghsingensis]|uniref:ABC transporter ATP-binding protein n=1 Tax=Methanocalculus chunghsingensis TaxID=156457 RepID=A0A8J8B6C7_9EURY|nr:ABC transporter ATP-binding protein [Methanocalculus chunghsingensis]
MSVPAIEFKQLSFAYSGRPDSLKSITFSLRRGSKTALVGPNGAGKTTLLLMCNGTLRPTSGTVVIGGGEISYDARSLREIRRRVGMVFQNSDAQLFAPTVYQDVAFGPLNIGISDEDIGRAVAESLFAVGLAGYERRPPHHLSGGEKKRVAIAGVLAMQPEILIFDEPTSSLDPAGAAEIMDLLDELHHQGVTILLSTHDVELAYQWADDVVLIADGEILHHGPPATIFCDTDLMRRAHLTMPTLLSLYHHLVARRLMQPDIPPGGIPDMAQRIEEITPGGIAQDAPAPIHLLDTGEGVNGPITALRTIYPNLRIGVMGTAAKRTLAEAAIIPDVTYGVIDTSILHALRREPVLIITTGGMIERVKARVLDFSRTSGISLSVLPLRENDTTEEI